MELGLPLAFSLLCIGQNELLKRTQYWRQCRLPGLGNLLVRRFVQLLERILQILAGVLSDFRRYLPVSCSATSLLQRKHALEQPVGRRRVGLSPGVSPDKCQLWLDVGEQGIRFPQFGEIAQSFQVVHRVHDPSDRRRRRPGNILEQCLRQQIVVAVEFQRDFSHFRHREAQRKRQRQLLEV